VWNTGLYHGGSFWFVTLATFLSGGGDRFAQARKAPFFTGDGIMCSAFVVTRRELALSKIIVNFVVN